MVRVALPDAIAISIEDVLSASDPSRIDFYALRTRFSGTPDEAISEPLHLSQDGRTLTLLGRIEISFKSDIQVKMIRQLFDAYWAGKRLKASVILNKAGSKAGSLDQAFGKSKWKELSQYLSSLHGLWGFDV